MWRMIEEEYRKASTQLNGIEKKQIRNKWYGMKIWGREKKTQRYT
jgi:hypothetical protein